MIVSEPKEDLSLRYILNLLKTNLIKRRHLIWKLLLLPRLTLRLVYFKPQHRRSHSLIHQTYF